MSRDEKSSYYDAGGIESIEVIQAKSTPDQYYGYLHGNVLKYAQRRNFKGCSARDTEKCGIYNAMLLELEHSMEWKDRTKPSILDVDECDVSYVQTLLNGTTAADLLAVWVYFENRKVAVCQVL